MTATVQSTRYDGFNPRLPGGRRRAIAAYASAPVTSFNPRLPGGRRRVDQRRAVHPNPVSIHAFRGEGDSVATRVAAVREVSIHAFRGEGDSPLFVKPQFLRVSIHAFRGEGDFYLYSVL